MSKPPQDERPASGVDRWFLVFFCVGLTFMLGVVVVSYLIDERLDELEGALPNQPATSYQPPNLDDYAAEEPAAAAIVRRQSVYVPVYSHVYYNRGRPYPLEATLSVRNRDPEKPIYLRSARYYDTRGELIRTPLDRLIKLGPLQTLEFLVTAQDSSGGSGANFVVDWLATEPVDEPLIEAIMVGAAGAHGIAFRAQGTPLAAGEDE